MAFPLVLALLAASVPSSATGPSALAQGAPTDILFLGNSYTGVNDLPGMVASLAGAAGIAVNVSANVPGGCTLGSPQGGLEHINNATSQALLAQPGWEFVVLQEQSVTPSVVYTKDQFMLPAAASLAQTARAASPDAEVVLYQTWGRAIGGSYCWSQWCSPNFADFDAMQAALTAAYDEAHALIAAQQPAHVAAVGEAWRQFFIENPTLELHAPDGSHANAHGTYLAACVMFTTLFGQSPVGNGFDAGLPPENAALLQDLAARLYFEPLCGVTTYTGIAPDGTLTFDAGDPGWPLLVTGSLALGSTLLFDAAALPPEAPGAWLGVALSATAAPFGDHQVLIDPSQLVLPLTYLPKSSPTFAGTIPTAPGLTGLAVFAQAAAFTTEWHVSTAQRLTLCP